ncbi:hypothetical protein [Pseudonocardia alaniniphila]|uniref:Lipoprotein n=1 Tax=Pseudonocardia alaniniphila TaxID=75291 RepID=A0ABS9TRI0_9PSEU|nr:hypothetical protein [Pseudonocardia alaniniphila]MCH6171121.1 hypothetical protein [Pseudonocardia alaniniphila]
MRGPAGRVVSSMFILVTLIMTASCTPQEPIAYLPPPGTYRPEDPVGEDSEARPVPPGTATTLTAALVAAGAFCVQIRSNADGRAVWCRNRNADDPWVAQFLLDRDDRLAWAWIPKPSPPVYAEPDRTEEFDADRVTRFAVAALGALWPDAVDRIGTEIQQYQRERRDRAERGQPIEGAFTRAWRDDHADYTMSSAYELIVAGRDAVVDRWPSDSGHYGGRMSEAVGDLQESGYQCFYPPQTVCHREFNDEFRVSLRGDRIVTANFDINGDETLADTFPRGLTFLAPDVRSEIAAKIEDARLARADFLGVVAGTVLAVDAAPVPPVGGSVPLAVRIGSPMIGTLPI